ncbi:hypothetical protein CRG98_031112 [Punica granatum]|uniref:CBS domain-containing protein n=1 Tax=Punica granatum TaxID=22663 RepID=A0A2I0IXU2_PUNGR|nr:hypothetical protein CRG98_031112 [Punica granatum]
MRDREFALPTAPTPSQGGEKQRLRDKKIKDLLPNTRRLVEVPYTASLSHTMNALVANHVVAVPVAAPPGQWIGAGGSMIMESDKHTGAIRKHYIGMVTMLDILAHIAGDDQMNDDDGTDLDQKMAVPVSNIIGHCLEGLSLWTLNPNTSILDCMEVFSKGIHRALVPVDSHMENVSGVELVESATSYRMMTQMDILRFLKDQHGPEMAAISSLSVRESGALNPNVFAITDRTRVIEAIKCMKAALLNAVPIVASGVLEEDHSQLIDGNGRKLIGTFSATDIRRCHLSALRQWLSASALEFTEMVSASPTKMVSASPIHRGWPGSGDPQREQVTCRESTPLREVMDKAVDKHVHRLWIVNSDGLLVGLVSLTDLVRMLRASLLSS